MYCPNCGHNNNDLATRCSACGSTLSRRSAAQDSVHSADNSPVADPPVREPQPPTIDLGPKDHLGHAPADSTEEHTAKREHVSGESPQPEKGEEPQFREVKRAAGRYAKAKRNRFLAFLQDHQRALGIGIAAMVIVVMGAVWFLVNLNNGPAASQIESDLSALAPTYAYAGGTYGPDLDVPLSKVNVTKREASQSPAGLSPSEGVGPGVFDVTAEMTYDDGRVQAVHSVSGTYVRSDDGWVLTGELGDQGLSLSARSGVDEAKVLANMEPVLKAASSGKAQLGDIYADGTFSVVGNNFAPAPDQNAATDDVVIRCEREDGFSTYNGNVTAHFAFESGEWRLSSAEADANATIPSFNQLTGTWTGSMVKQTADSGSCFGAKDNPVSITITSVGDPSAGGGQVQGTITCLAHYHEQLKSDQSSNANDVLVEDLAFWGTISTEYDSNTGSSLNITCSTAGEPRGKISFVLSFGTADDPSAAIARVTTTHEYQDMVLYLFPRQTTARFTDTYVLTHAS